MARYGETPCTFLCPSKPFEVLEIHQGAWDFSDEEEFSDDEEKAFFLFQVQDLGIEISNAHGKGSCLSALCIRYTQIYLLTYESFCSWIFTYIWNYVDIFGDPCRDNPTVNAMLSPTYLACDWNTIQSFTFSTMMPMPWTTSSNSVPTDVLVMKWSNKNITPHTENCGALFLQYVFNTGWY